MKVEAEKKKVMLAHEQLRDKVSGKREKDSASRFVSCCDTLGMSETSVYIA